MKKVLVCFTSIILLSLGFGSPLRAGLVDSPLPEIEPGDSTRLIGFIPGVVKNNGFETVVICTSLEKSQANVTIAVEFFDPAGGGPLNVVAPGPGGSDGVVQTTALGSTATIATGSTVAFTENDVVAGLPPNIKNGSARILSTSKRIGCLAFVVDELATLDSAPVPPAVGRPVSMLRLPVIIKKQRGD